MALTVLGLAVGLSVSVVQAQNICWTGSGEIRAANLDGSHVERLVTVGLVESLGIAIDPIAGKVYWTDNVAGRIQRANLDGSDLENLVTGFIDPWGIALDLTAGKMYWTVPGLDEIRRSDLDGGNVESLVTGLSFPAKIALDRGVGKMYWTDNYSNRIQRADLDGGNVEDIVTGLGEPAGIALDWTAGKVYWTDNFTHKIQRANLDGGNVEDLLTGLSGILAIELDLTAGKMYWTEYGSATVKRADLNGSNVEELVAGLPDGPFGLALNLTPPSLPCAGSIGGSLLVYANDFEDPFDPLSEWTNPATELTPVGARRFLGRFSDEKVTLTLTDLPEHGIVTLTGMLFVVDSWEGNDGSLGPDVWGVSVAGGQTLRQTTLANEAGIRQAYPDPFPGGDHAGGTGASAVDDLGYAQDATYLLDLTFLHSDSILTVDFAGTGLEGVGDESWGLDDIAVTVKPAGTSVVYSNDFEDSKDPLSEWSDPSTDVSPVGARNFLGRFSDETVDLTLTDLPAHDTLTVSLEAFVVSLWDGNDPTEGPDTWDVSVEGGPTLLHTTFANHPEDAQAYPDAYPGGEYPGQTGAAEVNTLGYAADSIYQIEFTIPHVDNVVVLRFSGIGLEGVLAESWGLDNVVVSVTGCEIGSAIPTISEWGMIAMTLLLLATGTIVFVKRPSKRTEDSRQAGRES